MEVKIENVDDITIVELPYEHLDASNCEELEKILMDIVAENQKVVLDIKNLDFIDSSGVGVLLFCVRKSDSEGGRISICNPCQSVAMAFDLVRIRRLCEVTNSREESIENFRQK